jgi:hypothetical protein
MQKNRLFFGAMALIMLICLALRADEVIEERTVTRRKGDYPWSRREVEYQRTVRRPTLGERLREWWNEDRARRETRRYKRPGQRYGYPDERRGVVRRSADFAEDTVDDAVGAAEGAVDAVIR